jgi:uncharacterized protein YlxW (UPF0749 family)
LKRSLVSLLCVTGLLAVVGILIVAQLRVQRHLRSVSYDRDEQAVLLSELVDANRRLRAEIESLTMQQNAYMGENRGAILEELVAELNRVRALNGAVEVSGPGIELLLGGLQSALDLQDVVNELRNAGAEAVALNGHRLVVNSVFVVEERGSIVVDGQAVSRPYRFEAIGDPDTLETALLRPGGQLSLFQRTYPNLVVQVTQRSSLVLGVHRPQLAFEYAEPTE